MGVGGERWPQIGLGAFSQAVEDVQVDKVHHSQRDQNQTDFVAHQFDGGPRGCDIAGGAQSLCYVPDVDQIEPGYKQTIDRIRQFAVTVKGVD